MGCDICNYTAEARPVVLHFSFQCICRERGEGRVGDEPGHKLMSNDEGSLLKGQASVVGF